LKTTKNYIGLSLGFLFFFLLLYALPEGYMPVKAQRMAAITALMAILWISEAIPISATALLPIVLYPMMKIMTTSKVTVNYGHHLVFLFLGGFIIALTIEKWNLHKRIALRIIHVIGSNQRMIILGFMIATAFLSMWISNTATTMMMIPIGLAIISQITRESSDHTFERGRNNFALALMLGIAYSASIGGISTLIGTPPNVVFIGILKSNFPGAPEISFVQWMLFALPFSMIFLPIAWFYLVYVAAPVKSKRQGTDKGLITEALQKLGEMSGPEKSTMIVFILTGILWILRGDIDLGFLSIKGWASLLGLKGFVHDSTVAIFMALLTFIIPAINENNESTFLMTWGDLKKIPWGILLLFGGGFAMANGFQESGLTAWLGEQLSVFSVLPFIVIVAMICLLTTFTTEFASNTAMATTLLPILASLGIALNINPMLLMIPATISASTAFMLPVATPPNAIVFGSGYIRIRDMVKIGIVMNIIGLVLITFLVYFFAAPVFNISWTDFPAWAK
jgi:solute carrier family 13 (sodium-dependent dicarboxylate transporter), member 2/3/5